MLEERLKELEHQQQLVRNRVQSHEASTSLMFLRVERETTSMALRQDEQELFLLLGREEVEDIERQVRWQQLSDADPKTREPSHRLSGKPQVRLSTQRCRELQLSTPGATGGEGFSKKQSMVFMFVSLQGIVSNDKPLETTRYSHLVSSWQTLHCRLMS